MRRPALFLAAALAFAGSAQAQSQTQPSPISHVGEVAPVAYYRRMLRADSLLAAGSAAAADAYPALLRAYPWDGAAWRRMARALAAAGRHREAARAFAEADARGVSPYPHYNAVDAARSFLRAGERDSAFAWLHVALERYRYEWLPTLARDTAFAPLQGDPRFQALIRPAAPDERNAGWRADLDYLLGEVRRMNAVYSHAPLPDSLVAAAGALRRRIPTLGDAQVAVAMQRLLAMLGQSHNNLFLNVPGARVRFGALPLTLYQFPDGVYVIGADSAHAGLVGSRLLKLDDTPADSAMVRLRALTTRDNPRNEWVGPGYLAVPAVMHALGVARSPGELRLTLEDRAGRTFSQTLAPAPFDAPRRLQAPRGTPAGAAPLYLSRPDDGNWLTRLPDGTVYVQSNTVFNGPGESLAQFGVRLRRLLADSAARDVVVDVRRNLGGNTYMYPELLRTLIAFDTGKDHRLFVIIGRATYSAATNFITDVDRLTNAVFVGEPSGGAPVQTGGDESSTVLPYSGLQAALSAGSWNLSAPRDTRPWITPDLPVVLTAADYFANRDPALEAILEITGSGGG
ncbi:MAG TPA: hypothetical protein VFJ82_11525 [Longimicrobium sp.]|nr:hypothetical protein [Longimicrobium sp.]